MAPQCKHLPYMTNENEVLDGVTQPGYDLICLLSLPDPYFWLTFRAQLARQALHSGTPGLIYSSDLKIT